MATRRGFAPPRLVSLGGAVAASGGCGTSALFHAGYREQRGENMPDISSSRCRGQLDSLLHSPPQHHVEARGVFLGIQRPGRCSRTLVASRPSWRSQRIPESTSGPCSLIAGLSGEMPRSNARVLSYLGSAVVSGAAGSLVGKCTGHKHCKRARPAEAWGCRLESRRRATSSAKTSKKAGFWSGRYSPPRWLVEGTTLPMHATHRARGDNEPHSCGQARQQNCDSRWKGLHRKLHHGWQHHAAGRLCSEQLKGCRLATCTN
mmetsp:Transcript_29034/g.81809  ORF Transcript_29034/g.81809 Transcript_29034/m.81809 type:complete len:261 (-) Transcript_29034:549-1331(-)